MPSPNNLPLATGPDQFPSAPAHEMKPLLKLLAPVAIGALTLSGCAVSPPDASASPNVPAATTSANPGTNSASAEQTPTSAPTAAPVSDEVIELIGRGVKADNCNVKDKPSEKDVLKTFQELFPSAEAAPTVDELITQATKELADFKKFDKEVGHLPLPDAYAELEAAITSEENPTPIAPAKYEDMVRSFFEDHGINVLMSEKEITAFSQKMQSYNTTSESKWTAFTQEERDDYTYKYALLQLVGYFHDAPKELADWELANGPRTIVLASIESDSISNVDAQVIVTGDGDILTFNLLKVSSAKLAHEYVAHIALQEKLCGFLSPEETIIDQAQVTILSLDTNPDQPLGTLDPTDDETVKEKSLTRRYIYTKAGLPGTFLNEISPLNIGEGFFGHEYAYSTDTSTVGVGEYFKPLQTSIAFDATRLKKIFPQSIEYYMRWDRLEGLNDLVIAGLNQQYDSGKMNREEDLQQLATELGKLLYS